MIAIKTIDRTALPAAMLALAKTHMRITWTTDDDYVKNCLTRAIDLVERHSGVSIFKTEADWNPVIAGTRASYQIPIQPVSGTFVATLPDTSDVTAAYQVVAGRELVMPVFMQKKDGTAFDSGVAFAIVAGYVDADSMPPQYQDPILRIAAHLYEHRESVDVTGLMEIPQWMNDLLLGNWIPRA